MVSMAEILPCGFTHAAQRLPAENGAGQFNVCGLYFIIMAFWFMRGSTATMSVFAGMVAAVLLAPAYRRFKRHQIG